MKKQFINLFLLICILNTNVLAEGFSALSKAIINCDESDYIAKVTSILLDGANPFDSGIKDIKPLTHANNINQSCKKELDFIVSDNSSKNIDIQYYQLRYQKSLFIMALLCLAETSWRLASGDIEVYKNLLKPNLKS